MIRLGKLNIGCIGRSSNLVPLNIPRLIEGRDDVPQNPERARVQPGDGAALLAVGDEGRDRLSVLRDDERLARVGYLVHQTEALGLELRRLDAVHEHRL